MEEIPSGTGGVKSFPIEGRLGRERERLTRMSDAERKMRAQWIKDQTLSPHEPVHVPAIEKELRNPIRRFYRYPLDKIFAALEPTLGKTATPLARYLTGKFLISFMTVYATVYYFKYHSNDWTRIGGWRMATNRPMVLPGDPGYPYVSKLRPQDYSTRGFENSPI